MNAAKDPGGWSQTTAAALTMSYDLYLFRLDTNADFKAARAMLDDLMDNKITDPVFDARDAVDALAKIEPRYGLEPLRRGRDFVQLVGPEKLRMADFVFSPSYISTSLWSGTTRDELDRYLKELCRVTGYSVLDPQSGQIYRLQPNGELE